MTIKYVKYDQNHSEWLHVKTGESFQSQKKN